MYTSTFWCVLCWEVCRVLYGFRGHFSQGGVKNPARSHEKAKVHEEYLIHGLLLFDVACANIKKMLRVLPKGRFVNVVPATC